MAGDEGGREKPKGGAVRIQSRKKPMKQTTIKIAGMASAVLLTTIAARADVPIYQGADQNANQSVSVYGYVAGSAWYQKDGAKGAKSDTGLDLDAAKLGLAFNFAPVTAKVSFYTDRFAADNDIQLLEANATYDLGNGLTITGGRYQSLVGYEAFDIPGTSFITYGNVSRQVILNNDAVGLIPNFSEGVRVSYAFDKFTASLSVVDSIYPSVDSDGRTIYHGDGSLSNGYGVEAHLGYDNGTFSASATLGYDKYKHVDGSTLSYNMDADGYLADLWAQYILGKTTFAAEFYYVYAKQEVTGGENKNSNYYALVMARHQFTEKFSLAGRVSAGKDKTTGIEKFDREYWKVSVAPTYAVTANFDVRAEVSYTDYRKDWKDIPDSNVFAGVQAIFKF